MKNNSTEINEAKNQALQTAISQIEKNFGKGSIMRLGEDAADKSVESVPTGSLSLDIALGIGGVPRGRIIEVYGPESGGKTTLALHMVAEVQKANGIAGFIDAEHALDPSYAAKLGVDINNLYVSQPDDGEQALDIAEAMVRSGAMDIIVIDSVAALVPRVEIDGEMSDNNVGLQARLMSKALRKLTAIASKSNCIIIFINQLREKIGVMFGNPETTTGGKALKFYASVRIEVRKGEAIKNGTEIIGNKTKAKIVENKVAPPFNLDIIQKGGAWYSYGDARIGQGRENAKQYLTENPDIALEIENRIREHYGLEPVIDYIPTGEEVAESETEKVEE